MAQKIKQGSIWGRVGTGIGQGVSTQIPKEIEHYQKMQGLNRFQQNYDPENPMQNYINSLAIRGLTPEQSRGITELSKQQAQNQAILSSQNTPQTYNPTPDELTGLTSKADKGTSRPSITSPELSQEVQKGFNLPTQDQLIGEAAKEFAENPARFKNDFNNAVDFVNNKYSREREIYDTKKGVLQDLQTLENNVRGAIKTRATGLNAQIPNNIYNKLEEDAIESVQPKDERYPNRKGLTQFQAENEFEKKLLPIANEYQDLHNIGNLSMANANPKEVYRTFDALRKGFKSRDDQKNMAETLVADNGITWELGYSMADPVKDYPGLNKFVKELPDLEREVPGLLKPFEYAGLIKGPTNEEIDRKTKDISPELAQLMKKTGASPLSIAYELEKKHYNKEIFMDYVNKHIDELKLNSFQSQQLNKVPRKDVIPLKDFWFSSFTGVE